MIPQIKKILYATDFSEASYEALKVANELALHFSAEMCVAHIVSPMPFVTPTDPATYNPFLHQEEMAISAKNSLQEMIKQRIPREVQVRQIVTLGGAADEIVQISKKEKVDLVVIATHGQIGWRRFVFGSVAEKVVRLAPCPVLTMRAPHEES